MNLYVNQLYDEIEHYFPKRYIVDTYKCLLNYNKYEPSDLGDLEKVMIQYLLKETNGV